MSIPSVEMNTGDLSPSIVATLQNSDGSVFDLTSCTVVFQLSQQGKVLFSKAASVVNAKSGVVEYDWAAGDTDFGGVCTGLFIVTLFGGATQAFPTVGVFYVIFPVQQPMASAVPAFTNLSEVINHLNCVGPDPTGNYTIYGLPIGQASLQVQVDHANKYLSSLVPTLLEGSGDARLPSAELAALDIACLGILVTVVGGSLGGATDYSLSDLHVNRAGSYAFAIKTAIDGYQRSAAANLANLSTVALAVNCTRYVPRYQGPSLEP
jgi:hypothetical protein